MKTAMKIPIVLGCSVLMLNFLSIAVGHSNAIAAPNCGAIVSGATESAAENITTSSNVLLEKSKLPFGAFPYDRLASKDFAEAFTQGLAQSEERLAALRSNKSKPTYTNTIKAILKVDQPLLQAQNVFYSLIGAKTDETLEEIESEFSPQFSRFENSVYFDVGLFARVEKVYASREKLGLTSEEMKVTENLYRTFVRRGAKLSTEVKARIDVIDDRMAFLGPTFKKNMLAESNAYELHLTKKSEIKGVPVDTLSAAKGLAKFRKVPGWIFNDQSIGVLLTHAQDRAIREKVWRGGNGNSVDGPRDNRPILFEIVQLRNERAKLLGYQTHAHYVIDGRMAETPEKAVSFLEGLSKSYYPHAVKDLKDIRELAGHEIEPWDLAFYSNKLSEQRFGFSDQELKPYFPIDQVLKGAFYVAKKLYGVTFHVRKDLPAWDPSVQVFEVRDREDKYLALFYFDPYPRKSKRGGAWETDLQTAGVYNGRMRRPHVVNVTNVNSPIDGRPALLSPDNVTTIFHELGHGLHSMLTRVRERSISGTSVAWDFVELPSQLNENWAFEPEVLKVYARHYETGEPIPKELVAKFKAAATFQTGYFGLRQVQKSLLDLAWHMRDVDVVGGGKDAHDVNEVDQWELEFRAPYQLTPNHGSLISPTFSHVFSGGYSAGYYSYKWADVLASDAFSVFQSAGIFDPTTSNKFLRAVLEKGGSEEAADLYRQFRGRDPDPNALLRKEGLLP